MNSLRALVLGDANADLVIRLPGSTPGIALSQPEPELHGGGSAANVAAALSRLEVQTEFIGAVGDDSFGRWTRANLAAEGVGVALLFTVHDEPTPLVIAIIPPGGARQIAVWPVEGGAQTWLRPEQIEPEWFAGAGWLHTSGICLRLGQVRQAILKAMRLAHQAGVTVSLDLNLRVENWGLEAEFKRVVMEAVAQSDVIFGSAEEELIPLTGTAQVEQAAEELAGGQRIVVARLGAEGALAAGPDGFLHSPAFPVAVVDTLGAGDAFDAGFIAARLNGSDLAEALKWGNAAAALKLTRPGARGSPRLAELKAFLEAR